MPMTDYVHVCTKLSSVWFAIVTMSKWTKATDVLHLADIHSVSLTRE